MRQAAALLTLVLMPACGVAPVPAAATPSSDWWSAVAPRLSAAAADFQPVTDGFDSTAGGLRARVTRDGAALHLEDDQIGLSLLAWGRDGQPMVASPAAPVRGACTETGETLPDGDCLRRVEQDHDGLIAWWVGRGLGLQQGWDLLERPAGDGPVVLDLSVTGADIAVEADGLAWLMGESGALVRYSDLAAWDAEGEPLASWLEPSVDGLRVVVDDTDATYPITIDPISTSVTTTVTGPSTGSNFGYAVAMAGDVNNDGYGDIVVGAYTYSSYRGAAYVYHGKSTGLATSASRSLTGSSTNYDFGLSVAGAGDVNSDGYDDIIVGAPGVSSSKGAAYVYHGSSSGVASTATSTISGSSASGQLGFSVAGAGDVNSDGYDDVVIGAITVSTSAGAAYVHHGSASGVSTTASRTITGSSGAYLGCAVEGAGDVNNDGYDDIIVGAYGTSGYTGSAYLYKGTSSGIGSSATATLSGPSTSSYFGFAVDGAGDVDGDGYDDVIVGASGYSSSKGAAYVYHGKSTGLKTTATTTLTGTATLGEFGIWVTGLGDADGDGYDDVLVTAYKASSSSGAAYTYAGSSAGVSSTVSETLTGTASSYFGICADGGSDIDGDGFPDAIVSASGASSGYGAVYLYTGEPTDLDGDGYGASSDCDDGDATIYPGAPETTGDEVDSDCDGGEICYTDGDGDRYRTSSTVTSGDDDCRDSGEGRSSLTSGDCDDTDATVYPGATETAGDEIDSDCDGAETCYRDADGDDYRTSTTSASADEDCIDPGEATASATPGDCDDSDPDVHPGATEVRGDGTDQDCDGGELCYEDADNDGYYGDDTRPSSDEDCDDAGEAGADEPGDDCDDGDEDVHPGAAEIAEDGIDQDCDGSDGLDGDGDGYDDASSGGDDCDDDDADVYPGASEVPYDGIDQDCEDGDLDDIDEDGSAAVEAGGDDCDDRDNSVHPGAPELDDGLDNDCDGTTEDDDNDGDGLSNGDEDDAGTDPDVADTDGDGTSDGDEVAAGTDPTTPNAPGQGGGTEVDESGGGCGFGLTPMALLGVAGLGGLARRRRRPGLGAWGVLLVR